MVQFKENLKPSTTVKVLQSSIPDVIISSKALVKMQLYVEGCDDEVGWLGTAYQKGRLIFINDVFLFDQEVNGATTEITPEGLLSFGEKLLATPEGMELWNNIKVWGHSHPNMSVSPSAQDDKQMETFEEGKHDWFLRIIANKKGDLRVDLYHFELGLIYNELPWEEETTKEAIQINEEIERLYKLLDTFQKDLVNKYKADINKEIEEKVKKKMYTYYPHYQQGEWVRTPAGGWTRQVITPTGGTTNITNINNKKKVETEEKTKKNDELIDVFRTANDVIQTFKPEVLMDIGECFDIVEVDEVLYTHDIPTTYTDRDLELMLSVGKQYLDKVYFGSKEV